MEFVAAVFPRRGNFDVDDYHGIAVGGVWTVELISGTPGHISVECDDNLLPLVRCEVENGVLHVRVREDHNPKCDMRLTVPVDESLDFVNISGAVDLHADAVTCSSLEFELSGATDATIARLVCSSLEVDASGASDLNLGYVECSNWDLDASGASDVNASGVADNLSLDLSGSSGLEAENLTVDHATVALSGAADAKLHIVETLSAGCSGSSGLEYSGSPELLSISTSGAGSVDHIRTHYPDNLY